MTEKRYDTFENDSEIYEMVEKMQNKTIEYMSLPDVWDIPTNTDKTTESKILATV